MRAAFKVATTGLKQASSATSTAQASSFSLSSQILRQGYASKAGNQPPIPPSASSSNSTSPSSSSSSSGQAAPSTSSSSTAGKPVSKNPNSESPIADPDRFKDAPDIPGQATTETFGQKDGVAAEPKAADTAASDAASSDATPTVKSSPSSSSRPIGTDIAPSSGLASQYLDATEVPMSAEEARVTGARARDGKHSLSSIEKKRRMYGRVAMASTLVGAGIVAWHMGREWENEKEKERLGRDVTDESGLIGRWQRGRARFADTLDYFNKPAWDPLLPDPLPPPHQKPYTLVISLDDLLIHSQWDREHGWRTAKRPGVDYFLAYLSQFYEIVLFTSQPAYTAIPIVDKLDPHMIYILYKLFRDSTRYYNKTIVKDLSYLGRDLSKVIMLDTNPEHFQLQPENAYAVPKWKGNRDDTDLIGMIPFLEAIAFYHVPDVRPVLKKYSDKHIPTAWAEVEREQKAQLIKEWQEEQEKRKGKLSSGGFSTMFGLGGGSATPGKVEGPPKTALENFREMSQKAYLEEQKYWAEHKDEIEKAMEEERKKQMEQMQSSVVNLFAAWTGVQPPPKPEDAASTPAQQQPNQGAK